MENFYKLAQANFEPKKLAHKICAKKLKIVQNEQKFQKFHTKMQKPFIKLMQKQKLAQLWKISTGGATAANDFFHLRNILIVKFK